MFAEQDHRSACAGQDDAAAAPRPLQREAGAQVPQRRESRQVRKQR